MERLLQLLSPQCHLDHSSVFYDIGSGLGWLAAFVRLRTSVRRVVGIEINRCRSNSARSQHAPLLTDGLALVEGDAAQLGFPDATHIYLAPQCWGQELLERVLSRRPSSLRCALIFGSADALAAIDMPLILQRANLSLASALHVGGNWDEFAVALVAHRGDACTGRATAGRAQWDQASRMCALRARRARKWLATIASAVDEARATSEGTGGSAWHAPLQFESI